MDIDIRQEGYIWHGSHERGAGSNITDKADDLVHQLSPKHSDFKTQTVYVATWEDVPNYPDGSGSFNDEKSSLRNTFQAALITDFNNTFLMYCYIDIEFSGRYQSAVVGYSAGDGKQFYNHSGSSTEYILQVSQFKTGNFTGLLFFPLTSTESVQSKADMLCQDWYCQDRDHFGVRPQWPNSLVPCPWTEFHASFDFRYIPRSITKERGGACYSQIFPFPFFDSISGESLTLETECCYRFGWLRFGSPFGGSSSPYHQFSQTELYYKLTAQPYNWCCLESNNCHLYFERRPSRSTLFYFALIWGECFASLLV